MTIDILTEICQKLPSVESDIKWEHNLCFTVGTKIFLMISLDDVPLAASFKVSDEYFEIITERDGIHQAPYMARNKWVKAEDISRFSREEWQEFIQTSYRLISSKLSKKKQAELGII